LEAKLIFFRLIDFPPYPRIIQRIPRQPCSHRILQHVINLLIDILFPAKRSIKKIPVARQFRAVQVPD
jgi:hypothetical protein